MVGSHNKSFRIEEVPGDQLQLGENEMLVPVGHYQKEPYSAFGNPFLLKVKDGECFEVVKERIQAYLVGSAFVFLPFVILLKKWF